MFKTGITHIGQLRRHPDTTKLVSAGLLIDAASDPELDGIRERIVRGMILPNTTGKTTWSGRFREMDEEVAQLLKDRFGDAVACVDVGVSDGTTAIDLFDRLASLPGLRYVMSDLHEAVFVRRGRLLTVACDEDGNLTQVTFGPFVVPITTLAHMHPLQLVNRALYLLFSLWLRPRARRAWQRSVKTGKGDFVRISLLSERARGRLRHDPRLRFHRLDIFDPPEMRCQFLRMMNVLNLRNGRFGFSAEEAARGVRTAASLLDEGGLLLLGRTVRTVTGGSVTDATLFEKSGGSLHVFRRFGRGSELESLARAGSVDPSAG